MYDFFFFTVEGFSTALERLRRSDKSWYHCSEKLLISFYEGCDADFLVGELALLGVGSGAYKLERPDRKKGGTEQSSRTC
ncbi:MAG: hypothetical protein UU64_C0001G0065 [candidate division WWE3 bacterium GW2011_GWF2_41_45]|uniref:Uncharacterized protein n=3 Tax=Katanobacteria TaxID=422282 RepID=A0A1F4W3R7_UNCKA|nr:MAG: hypothetical protein UU55_C0002G0024 [candidate division WWE3 bacterium GW2011_GWC2_41_23]KKS10796.1 MAG: hypothetical protein UU64_C0001G0065 [candidate division WWE3 bacterium GW2011_GWF2_41_45]KKS12472.1 MAG: hypothetical protein UU68_C0001G0064 [candidate division WWE3 bacterium GW2011_GWF1_41_53]KKS20149.1 MAG: hypothetical protein UU79_C0003G0022 [candidate division WWE3 bacterium GW2011_GWE1_41_72]KKS28485.1 MAG: hypothetical protein UU86_C0001G0005 [candidate division WWE3 bacte